MAEDGDGENREVTLQKRDEINKNIKIEQGNDEDYVEDYRKVVLKAKKRYTCSHCGYQTSFKDHFELHLKGVHRVKISRTRLSYPELEESNMKDSIRNGSKTTSQLNNSVEDEDGSELSEEDLSGYLNSR